MSRNKQEVRTLKKDISTEAKKEVGFCRLDLATTHPIYEESSYYEECFGCPRFIAGPKLPYLTLNEAAEKLGLKEATVRNLVRKGELVGGFFVRSEWGCPFGSTRRKFHIMKFSFETYQWNRLMKEMARYDRQMYEEARRIQRKERRGSEVPIGKIIGFNATRGSGIATLILFKRDGTLDYVICDNAQTVRALDDAFGGVIADGHMVNVEAIRGKEIEYKKDQFGVLESFDVVGEYDLRHGEQGLGELE